MEDKYGKRILNILLKDPGLLSFWDFQELDGSNRKAKGKGEYSLIEAAGPVERVEDGIFGPYSAKFTEGKYLYIPRKQCPELNIHGKDAKMTMIAWVKRALKSTSECEAVAGMWNEEHRKRQYCLFLNLRIHNSSQQVCGHISSVGGPTPGQRWCMEAAIGATPVPFDQWQSIAFTYDGQYACSYLNGMLDTREDFNPYFYDEGIFNGQEDGSDFTVAAVYRSGEMGNWYVGLLGGLAVFDRALSQEEIASLG